MAEKKTRLWKRIVGYSLFSLFALVATFFLTFPYEALKDRVRLEADGAGYFLRIDRMGPGFFALRATDVEVSKKSNVDPPPEALKIDSLVIGPSFFPPGASVKFNLLGGSVVAKVSGLSTTRVKIDVEDIDLAKGNLKGFSGIDFAGEIEAHFDLSLPRVASAPNAPAEPDLAQATGTMTFDTRGLAINGGTANITIAQFGPDPTPVDLPKILLGELSGKLKIEKGAATIEEFKSKSGDLGDGHQRHHQAGQAPRVLRAEHRSAGEARPRVSEAAGSAGQRAVDDRRRPQGSHLAHGPAHGVPGPPAVPLTGPSSAWSSSTTPSSAPCFFASTRTTRPPFTKAPGSRSFQPPEGSTDR